MGREDQFRTFALAFAPALRRLAYLLTGDLAVADRAAVAALARTRRRWRTVADVDDPEQFALRTLVRFCISRRPGRSLPRHDVSSTSQSVVSIEREVPVGAGAHPGPHGQADLGSTDPDEARRDALWAALRQLTPRERAALVLDHLPGWLGERPEIDTARALGVTARARVALGVAAGRRLEAAGVESFDVSGLLRATLAERADEASPLVDPLGEVKVVVSRTRRRQALVAATIALVVAGGAFVAVKHDRGHGPAEPTANVTPTAPATGPTVPGGSGRVVLDPALPWPIRGNLADDAALLRELRVRFVTDNPEIAGGVQVLYVADIDGARIAVLAGRTSADPETGVSSSWYVGTAGSPVAELVAVHSTHFALAQVQTPTLTLPDGRTLFVAFAPPEATTVEVSWRPMYHPDGRVTRAYESFASDDGVVVVDITGHQLWPIQVRVSSAGKWLSEGNVIGIGTDSVPDLADLDDRVSSLLVDVDTYTAIEASRAVVNLARMVGVNSAADVAVRLVWSGTLDTSAAVAMRITVRGGGEFLIVADASHANSAMTVLPKAAPDLPIIWGSRTPDGQHARILAMSKVVRAVLTDGATEVAEVPVTSGEVASLEVPTYDGSKDLSAQRVQLLDGTGRVVWSVPLMGLVIGDVASSWPSP